MSRALFDRHNPVPLAQCNNCGQPPDAHTQGRCPRLTPSGGISAGAMKVPSMCLTQPAHPHVRTSAERKLQPIATGVLTYFPLALAAIAEVSRRGNEKHNPGEPLHWAKEKSTDDADCCVRHITDSLREGPLALDDAGNPNLAAAAWRMLAWLERVLEGDERWRDPGGKPRE